MAYHNIFLDKLRIITDGLNEEYLGGREGGKRGGGREGRTEGRGKRREERSEEREVRKGRRE